MLTGTASESRRGVEHARKYSPIAKVAVSRPFFNPRLGQTIGIAFSLGKPGALKIDVIDSRQARVKRIFVAEKARAGSFSFIWDGRDEVGNVVPDEVYSLRIDLRTAGRVESYLPAGKQVVASHVSGSAYDRANGILRYEPPRASRVRITAGVASQPPDTPDKLGPPRKVLAVDEPRTAGAVIQQWDGYDETGSVYLPDVPGFAWWVSTVELPENAIITVGNRSAKAPGEGGK